MWALAMLKIQKKSKADIILPFSYFTTFVTTFHYGGIPAITVPQRRLKSLLTLLITNMDGEEGPEPFHITVSYCSGGNK